MRKICIVVFAALVFSACSDGKSGGSNSPSAQEKSENESAEKESPRTQTQTQPQPQQQSFALGDFVRDDDGSISMMVRDQGVLYCIKQGKRLPAMGELIDEAVSMGATKEILPTKHDGSYVFPGYKEFDGGWNLTWSDWKPALDYDGTANHPSKQSGYFTVAFHYGALNDSLLHEFWQWTSSTGYDTNNLVMSNKGRLRYDLELADINRVNRWEFKAAVRCVDM